MASCTLNGTTYNSLDTGVTAGVVTAGTYTAMPPFGQRPQIGAREYTESIRAIPGVVTGVGTMRFAGPMRGISVQLITVQTTEATAHSTAKSLLDALTGYARYNLTVNGVTYNGCKLVRGSASEAANCIKDKYAVLISLEFRQLQES
jgi:hypothetical protein